MATTSLPPGPGGLKFSNAMKMGLGAFDFITDAHQRYGDSFTIKFPGLPTFVWLTQPDLVKQLFSLKAHQYDQELLPLPIDIGTKMTGFLNGSEHQHSRKMVIPSLTSRRLESRADFMFECAERHIDSWNVGDQFDTPRKIGDISLDIAIHSLLGLSSGERHARYKRLMLDWIGVATNELMFTLGTFVGSTNFRLWLHKKYRKQQAKGELGIDKKRLLPWSRAVDLKVQLADMFIEDIRATRAEHDDTRSDLFAALCRATYEDGSPLPEERIIAEAMGILVGGHETTAASSAWHMLWMLKRPDVFERCREEVLASVAEHGRFDPLRICELPYCNAALKESMRLTPSALGAGRCIVEDMKFGDYLVPAGCMVVAGAYIVHRRKDIWGEDAEAFNPERWLSDTFSPTPFEYFPFGGGRRTCIGASQAKQQLRIIWGDLYRRVEFDSEHAHTQEWPGQRQISGQIEPKNGVEVTVTSVKPSNTGHSQPATSTNKVSVLSS